MNIYINAKEFRNDDISIMFGKDLITIEELVDKIYELSNILEDERKEKEEKIEELEDEVDMLNQELLAIKNGFRPDTEYGE